MKKILLINLLTCFSVAVLAQATITANKTVYNNISTSADSLATFTYTGAIWTDPTLIDWIGVYDQGVIPSGTNYWTYWYVSTSGSGTETVSLRAIDESTAPISYPTFLPDGFYDAYLMDGCCFSMPLSAVPFSFEIRSFTGINEKLQNASIQIYPNPSTGNFMIKGKTDGFLQITDLAGRVVYSENLNNKQDRSISADLSKGVYIARVSSAKSDAFQKLIVQ